jgi:hypothetical protein
MKQMASGDVVSTIVEAAVPNLVTARARVMSTQPRCVSLAALVVCTRASPCSTLSRWPAGGGTRTPVGVGVGCGVGSDVGSGVAVVVGVAVGEGSVVVGSGVAVGGTAVGEAVAERRRWVGIGVGRETSPICMAGGFWVGSGAGRVGAGLVLRVGVGVGDSRSSVHETKAITETARTSTRVPAPDRGVSSSSVGAYERAPSGLLTPA